MPLSIDAEAPPMRYATAVLTWGGSRLHPIDELFEASEGVGVEAIRYVSPVHEGRYVELLELRGDLDRARELLSASPDAVEFDVAGAGDRSRGVAYVQCRTAGPVDDLLRLLHEHDVVLDWPMNRVDVDGTRGLRFTILGTSRAIRRAADELPDDVRLRLERMGEYDPDATRLPAALTDRQLEVLDVAVELGYYETPRRTTHREIGAELGVSAGTVSEHLQRIESKIVAEYVS